MAGVEEALLTTILSRHGVSLEEVELINVKFSLSPALMSKQVEAVIGAFRNFELNQMDIENVPGRCIYIEEEGVPAYDEWIYVANPDLMDRDMLAFRALPNCHAIHHQQPRKKLGNLRWDLQGTSK